MIFFSFFLIFLISSTYAAEYCETEECVRLAGTMKSFMNKSMNPCDDFFEYACGNYSHKYYQDWSRILDEDYRTLTEITKTFKPNISNEKVALAILQKCVNDSTDNLDTFMREFWENTDDLTKMIIEVTKLNHKSGGIFVNDIRLRPPLDGPGHTITMKLSNSEDNDLLPLKDVESRVKFMNLTEYFYQLLPEGDRRYGALDDIVFVDESILTIDEIVEKKGKATIKQKLYSEWKALLEVYMGNRKTVGQCIQYNMINLLPGTSFMFFLGKILKYENFAKGEKIFEKVRREANEMIEESTWLDEDTKSAMLSKLNSVATSIGIPDELRNQTVVDAIFDRVLKYDIEEQSYLTLIRNVLIMKSEETFLEYSKLQPVTFEGSPFIGNANYFPITHRITVAPFFLKFPFINENLPEWSYLASYAYVVGHEIGHMFDPSRLRQDENMQSIEIDEGTEEEYNNRKDCLVDMYSEFKFPGFDKYLDGSQTIDENFADQFGFQLAHRLFEKLSPNSLRKLPGLLNNSTIDQQFFLRMAHTWCGKDIDLKFIQWYEEKRDTHSPYVFRVNGIASNSPEFAAAFGCAVDSAMNPEEKCELF